MDEYIRKQTVLNMIDDVQFGNITNKLSQLHEAVRNLPSAQKKGHWVKQNPMVDTEECSVCGYNILSVDLETPFCPWCGADMRGEDDG